MTAPLARRPLVLLLAVLTATAGMMAGCKDDDPYPYRKPWYTVTTEVAS